MMDDRDDDDDNDDGDQLDFYDFLDIIGDKFDSIAQQIEERKEDSLQRIQRTKNEIEQQKRLLRTELQHHVHVLSENLKKPNFIRTRDKIMFTIGVANACFSPLIAGKWPHILPMIYTIQALCLITLRFFIYKHKHWHYFVYDLCYYINLLTLIYLWILPSSKILFSVTYTLCHGPLAFAIVLWKNSLVFHNFDKITSLFIHMYPLLTMFTIRWILPADLQREKYPAIDNIGPTLPFSTTIFYTVLFYLVWQILYYIFIVYGRRDKISRGLRVTSYTWLLTDKKGFVANLITKFGLGGPDEGINRYKILFYFFLQFGYMIISILPVALLYYRYMYANVALLCIVFGVSVYNGASFYIDVFSHQYIQSLELLQGFNDIGAKNTSSTSHSQQSLSATKNTSDNNRENKNKKHS